MFIAEKHFGRNYIVLEKKICSIIAFMGQSMIGRGWRLLNRSLRIEYRKFILVADANALSASVFSSLRTRPDDIEILNVSSK